MFPLATRDTRVRRTCVILDMEDFSIPDGLSPYLIEKKIKTTMFDAGYRGTVHVRVCLAGTWSDELQHEFRYNGVRVYTHYQGDKERRLRAILVDVIFWTWLSSHSSNVLILSKNHECIEQDPRFCRFREALKNKNCCVVSALPETLINQSIIEEDKNGKLRDNFY